MKATFFIFLFFSFCLGAEEQAGRSCDGGLWSAAITAGAVLLSTLATLFVSNWFASRREHENKSFEIERLDKQFGNDRFIRTYEMRIDAYSEYLRRTFPPNVVGFIREEVGDGEDFQRHIGEVLHKARLLAGEKVCIALTRHYGVLLNSVRKKQMPGTDSEEKKCYDELVAAIKEELDNDKDFIAKINLMEEESEKRKEETR